MQEINDIVTFFKKVTGNYKTIFERMLDSYQKAQRTIYFFLKTRRYKVRGDTLEGENKILMDDAIANFMFGYDAEQVHLDKFDIGDIESIGYQLIEKNQNLKNLVLESMRMHILLHEIELVKTSIHEDIIDKYMSYYETHDMGGCCFSR